MKIKHIIYLLLILTLLNIKLNAQDPIFVSNRACSKVYNPAVYGLLENFGVSFNYRHLYPILNTRFSEYSFNTDLRLNEKSNSTNDGLIIGTGINASRYFESSGALQTNQANINLSVTHIINRHRNFFSFGLRGGIINKALDRNNLIFSDQLDPVLGNIYQSSILYDETKKITTHDIGAGFCLYLEDLLFYYQLIELSVNHISYPNVSFDDNDVYRFPALFTFSYTSAIKIDRGQTNGVYLLKPKVFYSYQKKNSNLIVGTDFAIQMFTLGANLRLRNLEIKENQTFINLSTAFNAKNFSLIYNFEFPFTNSISAMGIHEISLNFYIENNNNMNINDIDF